MSNLIWERLQAREAEEYHRSVEAQRRKREEDLKTEIQKLPDSPWCWKAPGLQVADRELHELTHLPYIYIHIYIYIHLGVRHVSVVVAGIFPIAKSNHQSAASCQCFAWTGLLLLHLPTKVKKIEGNDMLLMSDGETGYVAAIPAKGAESHPLLADMAGKK